MQLFRVFWSGFRLEFFSPDLCLAFFRSGKASQHIYYSVLIIFLPNCYIGRVSLCLFHKLESFFCPSLYWQCGDYQQAFQSGHLSQTHTTMDILLTPRAEGQFIPLMTFASFSYVCLSFLRLRWPDETSSCVILALTTVVTIVFFQLGTYYILLSHWHWPLRCAWQG